MTTVARAVVTVRDCLADAPTALLVDLRHAVVPESSATQPLVRVAREALDWPGTPVGVCASPAAAANWFGAAGITTYADVAAGLAVANRMPIAQRATLHLYPDDQVPARSRAFVHTTCADWDVPGAARLAELIISELVTNAVVHARTAMVITLRLIDRNLQVMVRDGDPRPITRPLNGHSGAHDGEHGRGLLVLDAMADGWGSVPTADGKVVWARVPLRSMH